MGVSLSLLPLPENLSALPGGSGSGTANSENASFSRDRLAFWDELSLWLAVSERLWDRLEPDEHLEGCSAAR